jgi:putative membrane protein
MKKAALIAMLIGLLAMTLIVAHEGAQGVAALLSRSLWLLPLMVLLHGLPLLPDAVGWRALILGRARLGRLYWIATVRQAVNRLLPVASIGGELIGMRLLAREGVARADAVASVIVEVFVTLMSQYLFVIVGVLCLLGSTGALPVTNGVLIGLATTLPAVIVLALLLRHGTFFSWLHRAAARLFGQEAPGENDGAAADAAIRALSRSYLRQARALVWQFTGMLIGCLETWCALYWFDPHASFQAAVVFESLTQAARHLVFFVPAGLGVQELSFIGVGHMLGVGGDVALAVSLARRASEIVFGVPALVSWQWVEGHRLFRARRRVNE